MSISRRRLMEALSLALGVAPVIRVANAQDLESRPAPSDAGGFIARASEMRRHAVDAGDHPYGAVVVRSGRIVGEAPSRVVVRRDPTAHAEMEAIRDAARRLGTDDLSGCVLYSTSAPCRMCETAAYFAGLERSYSGAAITDNGRPRYPSC